MKVEFFLNEVRVIDHEVIFKIFCGGDFKIDHMIGNVDSLFLKNMHTNKRTVLGKPISGSEQNTMEFKVPLYEFEYFTEKFKLMLSLRLDEDEIIYDVYHHVETNVSIYFNGKVLEINALKESLNETVVINKDLSDLKVAVEDVYSYRDQTVLKGSLPTVFLNEEIKLNRCFVQHQATQEKIYFDFLSFTIKDTNFNVSVSLKDLNLYSENWVFGIEVNIGGRSFEVGVLLKANKAFYSELYLQDHKPFMHKIFSGHDRQIIVRPEEYKNEHLNTAINDVKIEKNTLQINFTGRLNSVFDQSDKILSINVKNRNSNAEHTFPLIEKKPDTFIAMIDFITEDFFEEEGIWDFFVNYTLNQAELTQRLSFNSFEKSKGNFTTLPQTIYNHSLLKRGRLYATYDNNLALLIKEFYYKCDIKYIDYQENALLVKGDIDFQNENMALKDIFLEDDSGKRLNCENQINKAGSLFHFESSFKFLNLDKINEKEFFYYMLLEVNGEEFKVNVRSNADNYNNKNKSHIYPPFQFNIKGYPAEIKPRYVQSNELAVSFSNSLKACCRKIEKRKKDINIEVSIKNQNDLVLKNTFLVLENMDSGERVICRQLKDQNDNTILFSINSAFVEEKAIKMNAPWKIFLCFNINGYSIETEVSVENDELISKYSTFKSRAVKFHKNAYYSVFVDKNKKILNFELRDLRAVEKRTEKVKFLLAAGAAKLIKRFIRKPVWFIGENLAEVAQDNGFAFFEYCIRNKSDEKYYYISVKNNKNQQNLEGYKKNIIIYDSFKHYVFYHLSRYLIVSHGIRDVIPSVLHNRMKMNNKEIIYLQHGIIAMKKLQFNRKSYNGMIKKFVVSSNFEKSILVNEMNFKESQIMVTGLSRFDTLTDNSRKMNPKEIVVMPTWREWINENEFSSSSFYENYISLLKNENLKRMLEKHNVVLKFFMHIELQKKYKEYFSSFCDRVKVVNLGEESIKDIIRNSSLLITDYSSVVFDFNYLRKPVLFFHFDLPDYLKYRGSYVDLHNDLIGDTAKTSGELIELINKYIRNDFKYDLRYHVKSRKFYKFQDRGNSERIYQEIKSLNK